MSQDRDFVDLIHERYPKMGWKQGYCLGYAMTANLAFCALDFDHSFLQRFEFIRQPKFTLKKMREMAQALELKFELKEEKVSSETAQVKSTAPWEQLTGGQTE